MMLKRRHEQKSFYLASRFFNFHHEMFLHSKRSFDVKNPLTKFLTYLILLYTSSSAISRPSLLYVVSTNTRTFGSILSLASDLWSCVFDGSDGDLFSVWQWINGIGFVSRRMSLLNMIREKWRKQNVNLLLCKVSKAFLSCDWCVDGWWRRISLVLRLMFQLVCMSVGSELSSCQVSLNEATATQIDGIKWNVLYLINRKSVSFDIRLLCCCVCFICRWFSHHQLVGESRLVGGKIIVSNWMDC